MYESFYDMVFTIHSAGKIWSFTGLETRQILIFGK